MVSDVVCYRVVHRNSRQRIPLYKETLTSFQDSLDISMYNNIISRFCLQPGPGNILLSLSLQDLIYCCGFRYTHHMCVKHSNSNSLFERAKCPAGPINLIVTFKEYALISSPYMLYYTRHTQHSICVFNYYIHFYVEFTCFIVCAIVKKKKKIITQTLSLYCNARAYEIDDMGRI